jgi:uncharacterized protein (DUF1919 family)
MKQLSKVISFISIKIKKSIFNLVLSFVFKKDITIISSNCIGTRIYQSAKKKYDRQLSIYGSIPLILLSLQNILTFIYNKN